VICTQRRKKAEARVDAENLETNVAVEIDDNIEEGNIPGNEIEEDRRVDVASFEERFRRIVNGHNETDSDQRDLQIPETNEGRHVYNALESRFDEMEMTFQAAGLKRGLVEVFCSHFETHGTASVLGRATADEDVNRLVEIPIMPSAASLGHETPEHSETLDSSSDLNDNPNHESSPCAVCLENFFHGDKIISSSNDECPHVFHETCILSSMVLPMVRKTVASNFDEIFDVADMPCPCCRRQFCIPSAAERDELLRILMQCILKAKTPTDRDLSSLD
jgi:hypothetical protein